MGILDNIKNIFVSTASNAIGDVLNQVKDEASDALNQAKEEVTDAVTAEIKEKTKDVIIGGVKNYLNTAQEKVTTKDGKEAINTLQNLVDDSVNLHESAVSGEANDTVHMEKTMDDLNKLAEIADNQNNEN